MYIEFNPEYVAETLCKMAMLENNIKETEKALYHIKAIAENPYNDEYFRTFIKVLDSICNIDFLED